MLKFLEIQYKLGKITKEQFELLSAKFAGNVHEIPESEMPKEEVPEN